MPPLNSMEGDVQIFTFPASHVFISPTLMRDFTSDTPNRKHVVRPNSAAAQNGQFQRSGVKALLT